MRMHASEKLDKRYVDTLISLILRLKYNVFLCDEHSIDHENFYFIDSPCFSFFYSFIILFFKVWKEMFLFCFTLFHIYSRELNEVYFCIWKLLYDIREHDILDALYKYASECMSESSWLLYFNPLWFNDSFFKIILINIFRIY